MGHDTLFSYNSNNIKKATTEIGIEIDNTQQVFKEKMSNNTLQKSSEKLKKKGYKSLFNGMYQIKWHFLGN